jgi:hypothetical protein
LLAAVAAVAAVMDFLAVDFLAAVVDFPAAVVDFPAAVKDFPAVAVDFPVAVKDFPTVMDFPVAAVGAAVSIAAEDFLTSRLQLPDHRWEKVRRSHRLLSQDRRVSAEGGRMISRPHLQVGWLQG